MATTGAGCTWDPYDVELNTDPYPVFARLRAEAPLYYNAEHDFYAVSRYEDVERGLKDRSTFLSGRGGTPEMIKSGFELPSGLVVFEDPPTHTIHRSLLSRMFTPRRIAPLEEQIRRFCADALDPVRGSSGFDVIEVLGATMPARVIGMLMGLPDDDALEVRGLSGGTSERGPMDGALTFAEGFTARVNEHLDQRAAHPGDDVMSELLAAEFDDETGARRTLRRDEVAIYSMIVLGAGNETTTRLIGWAAKVLADHPDQRRQLVEDRSLIPQAIEELLRYEPPAPVVSRYVASDATFHGQVVPAGSVLVNLIGSANRDEARFPDGSSFDLHRRPDAASLTFGLGPHFCLGAALARLEARIALEELLDRFPTWDVDLAGASLSATSLTRGWDALPLVLP